MKSCLSMSYKRKERVDVADMQVKEKNHFLFFFHRRQVMTHPTLSATHFEPLLSLFYNLVLVNMDH